VGVGGLVDNNPVLRASFDALYAVKPDAMPIPEAIARAAELLEETVARHADAITALARQSPNTEN
jgi:hypothetical protein